MSELFDKNHVAQWSQGQVNEICRPLFDRINLSYFHYGRAYKDNTVFSLYTSIDAHEYFWKQGYRMHAPMADDNIILGQPKISLWSGTGMDNCILSDARNLFNADHPLAITIPQKDYYEIYAFGTHAGNDAIINDYFNHMHDLMQFTNVFRDKADHLITEGESTRQLPAEAQRVQELNILQQAKHLAFTVRVGGRLVRLSPRESDVARCLCWGMSARSIANKYSRSMRTIETHIENLKEKLGVRKKSEIISLMLAQLFW
ncbi:MAG: helix-turn-helix transcriptional regulator [Coxiellaceae bacterium]|nr:helix-turn-helix transcriptional regulator [Coxiellaceae bacterium]